MASRGPKTVPRPYEAARTSKSLICLSNRFSTILFGLSLIVSGSLLADLGRCRVAFGSLLAALGALLAFLGPLLGRFLAALCISWGPNSSSFKNGKRGRDRLQRVSWLSCALFPSLLLSFVFFCSLYLSRFLSLSSALLLSLSFSFLSTSSSFYLV